MEKYVFNLGNHLMQITLFQMQEHAKTNISKHNYKYPSLFYYI